MARCAGSCYPRRLSMMLTMSRHRLAWGAGSGPRACSFKTLDKARGENRLVAYLVILVLVAVLGILRLWIQQRRELSQLDEIDGFSSVLEAIKPEMPASRPPLRSARDSRGSLKLHRATRRIRGGRGRALGSALLSWFVARPGAERARRVEARRRIEARRAARNAALSQARRSYRPPVPLSRDIAYEPIDLTDERVRVDPPRERIRYERVPVAATQPSYTVRYRHGSR